MQTNLESLARTLALENARREARHLEALRQAGIPLAFEADAMASMREARYVGQMCDTIFDAVLGARKLDVFAGSPKAYTQPLWCRACGARYSQDCTCPRYELRREDMESAV